uniref:PDZ domain-containing protein n=1 Tax=Ascaris lumbricoides TaxID=6252 RepID=A0A0M3I1D5_ASCLU
MEILQNVVVKTKRALGKKIVAIMREKILLEKSFPDERLGLGIAIESDDKNDSVLSVRVEQVEPNSIAYTSGMRVGDRIWYVAGKDVHECSRHKCLALFHQNSTKILLIISRHKPASLQKRAGRCSRAAIANHIRPQSYSKANSVALTYLINETTPNSSSKPELETISSAFGPVRCAVAVFLWLREQGERGVEEAGDLHRKVHFRVAASVHAPDSIPLPCPVSRFTSHPASPRIEHLHWRPVRDSFA